jgi:signal transduction histidine kinase
MDNIFKPKLLSWQAGRHRCIFGAIIFALLVFEVWEEKSNLSIMAHMLEMLMYVIFLCISGILIDGLIRTILKRDQYLQILDTKYKLSLDLASCEDWDVMVNHVVEFPSRITKVERSCLYRQNPVTHEFREIARWEPGLKRPEIPFHLNSYPNFLALQPGSSYAFCEHNELGEAGDPASRWFCLPLVSGAELIALLRFQTVADRSLSSEERFLFENIGDEISVALKAGQSRRVMREISDAEISLNERRKVSYYLHDNLAQNMGYLRLKLDQILSEKDRLSPELFESDLVGMQGVVNESFDSVRGILETLNLQSAPGFVSTLGELTRKMGQRASLEVDFHVSGEVLDLPVETSQALLYSFQEILRNIEIHAHSTRVDIRVQWKDDELDICVSDNGIGFIPVQVDTGKHFGLRILRDRLAAVGSRIKISSNEMIGTMVEISTPLRQSQLTR